MTRKLRRTVVDPVEPNKWEVEPEWCSQRLFEMEKFDGPVWDPLAGSGRIVKAALDAGLEASGSDIIDRGFQPHVAVWDFTWPVPEEAQLPRIIVTNPGLDNEFAEPVAKRALELADKVAMMLPFRWLIATGRSEWLETTPLVKVLLLTPRPIVRPGQIIYRRPDAYLQPTQEQLDGTPNANVDLAWFIWERGYDDKPQLGWCRRDAGREGKGRHLRVVE